ncbi:MAG: peptidoglycan DD-metalloendopeptidase family protein [Provencibacterium sp.]|nr:peptidoglycan DD-metalloendopeptidase family protein [Provencibacterium sp.]
MKSLSRRKTGFCLIGVLLALTVLLQSPVLAAVDGPDGQQTQEQQTLPGALSEDDFKDELNALSGRLLELQQRREQVNAQLASARSDKEIKLAEKAHWETEIQLAKDEIAVLEERIYLLEQQIEEKLSEIADKQAEIEENYALYRERMRAMYLAGESSTLSMVLGASDFTDFLMRTEVVRSTAQHDQKLLEQLKAGRETLEAAKAALESARTGLQEDEKEVEEKRAELEEELNATKAEIEDISLLEQAYLTNRAQIDEMDRQTQAQIDEIYKKIDNSGEFVGGVFGWPLPGFTLITSYYGWRFSNSNFHTGIDISGSQVYGHSVRASNSGTVAYVQESYVDGVGYGKHVIVNHGGGYTTLYAHLSSISVSEGDFVSRGVSEIGKVGSTGWSTGPHLHFEVRIDGKHQNPLDFLQG